MQKCLTTIAIVQIIVVAAISFALTADMMLGQLLTAIQYQPLLPVPLLAPLLLAIIAKGTALLVRRQNGPSLNDAKATTFAWCCVAVCCFSMMTTAMTHLLWQGSELGKTKLTNPIALEHALSFPTIKESHARRMW